MPSSLKKFILDDSFIAFSFFLTLFLTLSRVFFNFRALIDTLSIFALTFCVFFAALKNIKVFKYNLWRGLSSILLITSCIISYFSCYGAAGNSIFFQSKILISVFFQSFVLSIRLISAKDCNFVYKKLALDVLGVKAYKFALIDFLFLILALLTSLGLFIFYSKVYHTVYLFWTIIGFSILSIIQTIRNPITFREKGRLDVFCVEKSRTDCSDVVLDRIKSRIVSRWIKKYNLPFVEECIMFFSRRIFSLKIVGKENIKYNALPSIFVANHGEIVGPVCGVSYMPVVFRPYVHDHMCDVDKSTDRMWRYTFSKPFGFLGEKKGKKVAHFFAKIVTKWINSFEPIHSYIADSDPRKSMKSMHDGLQCLMDGDSMLIFPENTHKNEGNVYLQDKVGELFSGFAHIGKLYYDKLKRDLSFYPVFINKNKKTFTIGEPVIFNSSENIVIEKKRVATELQKRMNEFI